MRKFPLLAISALILVFFLSSSVVPSYASARMPENPITPVQPVSAPNTKSCDVTIVKDQSFGLSTGPNFFTPFVGAYSPPTTDCPAPWSKVILTVTFSVQPGTQFDRVAAIWIGGIQIYKSSTAEPSTNFGPTWTVQKDVSEYIPVLMNPHHVEAMVTNVVVDGFNSQIFMTATLTFYETGSAFPEASHPSEIISASPPPTFSPPPTAPEFVLTTGSRTGEVAVNFPNDISQAYLEVYATPVACDEFWYGNQPTPYAVANGLCGGGAFREIHVSIDGELAGVIWPFPLINTGGWNPFLWQPIPAVWTFNTPAYVIDLTPFLGMLEGGSHIMSFQVLNNFNRWVVSANVLLFESSTVTGAKSISNTLSGSPVVSVSQKISSLSAIFNTAASRSFISSGSVLTNEGPVTTTVSQSMSFTNDQVLNLRNFLENLAGSETISTQTTTTYPNGKTVVSTLDFSYPIQVTSAFILPNATAKGIVFILPATVKQAYNLVSTVEVDGTTTFSSSLSYSTKAQALIEVGTNMATNGQTSESYIYTDSTGVCYNHFLAAAQGVVTTNILKSSCNSLGG